MPNTSNPLKSSNPRTLLTRAGVWMCLSIVFIELTASRIHDLRTLGLTVSPWRYLQLAFWLLMLAFWAWNGWRAYKRLAHNPWFNRR